MSYTRINWENAPSTATPVNATNLNKMDQGIYSLDQATAANTSDISTLQSAVSTNSSNISTLQTEIQGTGTSIALSINNSTYVMTLQLKNSNGDVLSTGTVDLPLETMVVGASYDSANKSIILTLQSGSTVSFSVADLVSGLVSESDLNTALSTLQSSISTNANNISTLQSEVSTNSSDISSLESAVSDLEDDKADRTEVYTQDEADELFVNKSTFRQSAGTSVTLLFNRASYEMTLQLKNNNGDVISSGRLDFPLESMVIGASYDSTNKSIILNLQNGSTSSFSIADLISGLESDSNKVTTISSASTNTQYPSAKAVYDYIQALNGNEVDY